MDFIWWLLGYVVPFLFVLGIVVIVHEFGHFIVARWCGVEVKAFSLGFGPELVGFNDRYGTRWRLAPIPLGGYVRFLGDGDATSTTQDPNATGELTPEERQRTLQAKSIGQRAAIVAAGPIFNFLFAILVFALSIYFNGRQIEVPRVGQLMRDSAAVEAGFKPRDLILSVDGIPAEGFADLVRIISRSAEQRLTVVVERDGNPVTLTATPRTAYEKSIFGTRRVGRLGLIPPLEPRDIRTEQYGLGRSLVMGVEESWHVIEQTVVFLGGLVAGRESADQVSGPIRIATMSGMVAKGDMGWPGLITLAAFLSVSIGFVNLMPVPLLDGGHLLFYLIEAIRGRPLSERVQEMGFRIGLALVVMLMLFTTFNDIWVLRSS